MSKGKTKSRIPIPLLPGIARKAWEIGPRRLFKASHTKVGTAPGALIFHGEKKVEKAQIRRFRFGPDRVREDHPETMAEALADREEPVTWINLDGLHEVEHVRELGQRLNLHSLMLEDILNTWQRPKVDDYGESLFFVVKMLRYDAERHEIRAEQLSLVLMPGLVLSFQEHAGDVFDPVRGRIRENLGRIRQVGADYLAYALLDAVVDHYFVVMESLAADIEALEELVVTDPDRTTLARVHLLKREMLFVRKAVWPLREALATLERRPSALIQESTHPFLRDLYDHTVQVIDLVESFRDMASGLQDLYLSTVSNRMNEVMKVLTLIATIFIPLTFIAGIYGMNFEHMPELHYEWAYPAVWVVMLVVGIGMALYFKTKKWL